MSAFQELLQKYVNEDYEALVGLAKLSVAEILPECQKIDKDNGGVLLLMSIVHAGIGADFDVTDKEIEFISDVLNTDKTKLLSVLVSIAKQPESLGLAKKFVDASSNDIKASTVNFIATICACDETITRSEGEYILSLLAD